MIPGSNLLKLALSVQAKHTVKYFRNTGRTQAPDGEYIPNFSAGVDIDTGQVQSVPLNKYELFGLDMAKHYVSWYVPNLNVIDVERGLSGDEIEWGGYRWKAVNTNADWLMQDGWMNVIFVRLGVAA